MALVCGAFGLANANANTIDSVIVDVVNVSALQDDGFKPVKFDELSEPIQKAISELNDEYALKSLAWNSEKQQARSEERRGGKEWLRRLTTRVGASP